MDQGPGKTDRSGSPATEHEHEPSDLATAATAPTPVPEAAPTAAPAQELDAVDTEDVDVRRLTAGLLHLHAERMRVLAREQRTRDRFTALHPEVAVTEVAALPGDVHDLAGLRAIGDRLTAGR